jgi:hypothetical protein
MESPLLTCTKLNHERGQIMTRRSLVLAALPALLLVFGLVFLFSLRPQRSPEPVVSPEPAVSTGQTKKVIDKLRPDKERREEEEERPVQVRKVEVAEFKKGVEGHINLDDLDATVEKLRGYLSHLPYRDEARMQATRRSFAEDTKPYLGETVDWELETIRWNGLTLILQDRYPSAALGRLWSGVFVTTNPNARAGLPPGIRITKPRSQDVGEASRPDYVKVRGTISDIVLNADRPQSAHVKIVLADLKLR